MSTPTRIRAIVKDGATDVRVLMTHPMTSPLRKDAAGQFMAAHYITDVKATLNGRHVLSAKWSVAVSQDPFLWFRVDGGASGDTVAITWLDNTGDTRTDSATVS
jgi:sulfur-oxidizing protein SoxZ